MLAYLASRGGIQGDLVINTAGCFMLQEPVSQSRDYWGCACNQFFSLVTQFSRCFPIFTEILFNFWQLNLESQWTAGPKVSPESLALSKDSDDPSGFSDPLQKNSQTIKILLNVPQNIHSFSLVLCCEVSRSECALFHM